MFNSAVRNTGRGARALGGWASRNLKRIYHLPGKIEKGLKNKIFLPIYEKFIQPVIGAVSSAGNRLLGALNDVPFIGKMTEALRKRGITWGSFGKFTGRWGKRLSAALPFIGGLGNFYFSKLAFDGGDNIGGVLEGLAGALTIGGGISTATGVGATWGGPMIALGTALDAYLLARILPGIGPAILQWEQDGGLLQIIPGLTGIVDKMTGAIGPSAQGKSKEVDKILSGKDEDKKGSSSGILGAISSNTDVMVSADKEIKKQEKENKKPWWKFWGGKKELGGSWSSMYKGQTISGYGKIPKAWNPFKFVIDIVKKPFEWVAEGVSTVAGWVGDAIEWVGNAASDIMNSQLGQVLSIALPIIFPQYKWIETLITGMRAFSALSNGNPIAAVMSLWNTASNIFPETFANIGDKVGTWFDNNLSLIHI